jgi:5-formyltetrahydrofolate cyclo-ligase
VEDLEPSRLKDELRRKITSKRRSLSKEEHAELTERILRRILNLPEVSDAINILLYHSIKGEPSVERLQDILPDRSFIFPRVRGEELELIKVDSQKVMAKGAFGIREPKEGLRVDPEDVELALVPGIAFDREGYRLGWGRGYYDRLLKRVGGFKVGVAYSFQVLERLPRDPWDVPVDAVVTEKEVIRRL